MPFHFLYRKECRDSGLKQRFMQVLFPLCNISCLVKSHSKITWASCASVVMCWQGETAGRKHWHSRFWLFLQTELECMWSIMSYLDLWFWIHFSFSLKAFLAIRLSLSFLARTLSSEGFLNDWRSLSKRILPSSFILLFIFLIALSKSSLTTSTITVLTCSDVGPSFWPSCNPGSCAAKVAALPAIHGELENSNLWTFPTEPVYSPKSTRFERTVSILKLATPAYHKPLNSYIITTDFTSIQSHQTTTLNQHQT